jgi:hypothetical protein
MDDWRALKYRFDVTSTVDPPRFQTFCRPDHDARRRNFAGTVVGDGDHYQPGRDHQVRRAAADGVRLQGLNLTAKGPGQGQSYDINGRAVAELRPRVIFN